MLARRRVDEGDRDLEKKGGKGATLRGRAPPANDQISRNPGTRSGQVGGADVRAKSEGGRETHEGDVVSVCASANWKKFGLFF